MKKRKYRNKRCSKGELEVITILNDLGINFIREKTYSDCLSPKGNYLRFDFFLPDFNILIEYQGHHHYAPINNYKKAELVHTQTVAHDRIKKQFVAEKGIRLLEIPYWDQKKAKSILLDELNILEKNP